MCVPIVPELVLRVLAAALKNAVAAALVCAGERERERESARARERERERERESEGARARERKSTREREGARAREKQSKKEKEFREGVLNCWFYNAERPCTRARGCLCLLAVVCACLRLSAPARSHPRAPASPRACPHTTSPCLTLRAPQHHLCDLIICRWNPSMFRHLQERCEVI